MGRGRTTRQSPNPGRGMERTQAGLLWTKADGLACDPWVTEGLMPPDGSWARPRTPEVGTWWEALAGPVPLVFSEPSGQSQPEAPLHPLATI